MTDTTKITTPGAFAALLERQAREREDAAGQLLDAEQREASAIANTIHPQVGTALVEALEGVERQIRADHRAGRLLAKVETAVPEWADRALPPVDSDDVEAGRRSVVVYVPRPFADGSREPVALAMIDVTDAVFGRGARQRRDQRLADDARAEAGRDREIQRARQREAARR